MYFSRSFSCSSLSQVHKRLHEAGLMVDVDLAPGDTFNKKIRNAQLDQYNFILGRGVVC